MDYVPRPRPNDIGELKSELIRNAAFVAYEGQKAKALARWFADGDSQRRVLYVFDTDVIVSLCAPWRSGPFHERYLGRGYGQILPPRPLDTLSSNDRQAALAEERRRAEAVCWLLVNKGVGRALEGEMPVLQTRSHFGETLRVFESVKANAEEPLTARTSLDQRQDHANTQALRFLRAAISAGEWPITGGNPGRFLSTILNRIHDSHLQQTSHFVREWDGFLSLVRRSNGIFSLSEFVPPKGLLSQEQEAAWDRVKNTLSENAASPSPIHSDVTEQIQSVIAPQHFKMSRDRLSVDSLALSELVLANRLLASETGGTLKVVLVTGDRKVVLALAAAQHALAGMNGASLSSFAFDHVHHLWSLVDSIANDLTPKGPVARSELFSGFLAFDDEEEDESAFFKRLVRYSTRGDQSLAHRFLSTDIDQAYEKWDDFSESAANLHRHFLMDRAKSEEISHILIEKLKTGDPKFPSDKLDDLVRETMSRARDRTKVEFSEIGANSILDAHRNGVRNPPDLMFDSLKVTDRIFKDLALPKRVFMNAEDFARRFEGISEDCYQPNRDNPADDDYRQECYLKYLVLGALFASADRWIVTEQHAESARRIIERAKNLKDPIRTLPPRKDGLKSNMSGREACFLLAVSKRVRAKTLPAYEQAENSLAEARECLKQDRIEGSGLGVPFIRFDCESLALGLSKYYHARWSTGGDPCDHEADEVFNRAQHLLDVRNEMARHDPEDRRPSGERLENLPASTAVSIATNLMQVAVIARFRDRRGFRGALSSPVDREIIKSALDTLLDHTNLLSDLASNRRGERDGSANEKAKVICSPLMALYAVTSAIMIGDNRIWTPGSRPAVDVFFTSLRPSVTAYDEWRFKMLREFAKELLLIRHRDDM